LGPQGAKGHISHAFATLLKIAGLHWAQAVVCALIISAGIAAYFFKQNNQRWYGMVEALFGVGALIAVASGISLSSATGAQWATMFGSAYVIARGLNNLTDATEGGKEPSESWKQLRTSAKLLWTHA